MLRAPAGCQNQSPQRGARVFEEGIVDISPIVAAIERAAIWYVERRTPSKTERQIRIREEQLPERYEIGASVRDRLHRAARVVIAVDDIGAVPQIPQTANIEAAPYHCKIFEDELRVMFSLKTTGNMACQ